MEKIRAFIAFKLSDEAKQELQSVQGELKKMNRKAHIGWAKSRGFHVTLEFLGEITLAQIEQVKEILLKLAREFHQFKYWLDDLDAFPNKAHPNVIIIKAGEEHKVSCGFQEKLSKQLRGINIGYNDHPWTPHVTLARNKAHKKIFGLNSVKVQPVVWEVNSVELIKSDLRPDGPRYTILESYSLLQK